MRYTYANWLSDNANKKANKVETAAVSQFSVEEAVTAQAIEVTVEEAPVEETVEEVNKTAEDKAEDVSSEDADEDRTPFYKHRSGYRGKH